MQSPLQFLISREIRLKVGGGRRKRKFYYRENLINNEVLGIKEVELVSFQIW